MPAPHLLPPAPCAALAARSLALLARWADAAERDWHDLPGSPGLGCYGTGYNNWGVQTNQKYLGAMSALAALGEGLPDSARERARDRALAALRFSLASHVSGGGACLDGTPWGNTWISALGIERMMYGVALLDPDLTEEDRAALRRVLCHEADWLLLKHTRGEQKGVVAGLWAASGRNVPESNLWNGALLWRAAAACPDHPHAGDWQEQAHRFLLNAVSVPADAEDDRLVAGRPVRERFVGANFFPNYGLDHHGYLNVGYMVICLSNAAMLHFDLKRSGAPRPESLDHHQQDLWQVVRRMVFADGRLARIGGDSRVRYAYCQDYLLPALLYAADRWRDVHALDRARAMLDWMEREADAFGDGSFFGCRLSAMRAENPYYFCRLESDRACVLGMTAAFAAAVAPPPTAAEGFEESVRGEWAEPEHGAVLSRSPSRFVSFAWRAFGFAQGLCLPPDDGHLAEWQENLGGRIRCLGDRGWVTGGPVRHRELQRGRVAPFPGGFITTGALHEGCNLSVLEGWTATKTVHHQLALAALPDGRTLVGLQHARALLPRLFLIEVKGMLLGIPNDVFNGFERRLFAARGESLLRAPAATDEVIRLGGRWANVEGRLGAVGLYGAEEMSLHRSSNRRGGRYGTLHVEELCWECRLGLQEAVGGSVILDVGWAVLSSADADETERFAEANRCVQVASLPADARGVVVAAPDDRRYLILANFASETARLPAGIPGLADAALRDVADGGRTVRAESRFVIEPGDARIFQIEGR